MMNPRPQRITIDWFRSRFGENFPDLLDSSKSDFLESCIADVYSMFAGVQELWDHLEYKVYVEKTQLCYGLLTAWYIADLYPTTAIGIQSSGGIPIARKKIGSIDISYADRETRAGSRNNADLLSSLKSNSMGAKAYLMIKASGKMNYLRRL